MIRNVKPASVNFETLDLETATAIRQFALARADGRSTSIATRRSAT